MPQAHFTPPMIIKPYAQNEWSGTCWPGVGVLAAYHTRCEMLIFQIFIDIVLMALGIESYNEGLDPIKSFVRWEKMLPQFIRKLRNQHVHYAQTIRILLEPITSEAELAEMMADPGSSKLWKGKQMVTKLKDRLQESYEAYHATIVDIERITKKIASKLDLDRAAEVSQVFIRIPRL